MAAGWYARRPYAASPVSSPLLLAERSGSVPRVRSVLRCRPGVVPSIRLVVLARHCYHQRRAPASWTWDQALEEPCAAPPRTFDRQAWGVGPSHPISPASALQVISPRRPRCSIPPGDSVRRRTRQRVWRPAATPPPPQGALRRDRALRVRCRGLEELRLGPLHRRPRPPGSAHYTDPHKAWAELRRCPMLYYWKTIHRRRHTSS